MVSVRPISWIYFLIPFLPIPKFQFSFLTHNDCYVFSVYPFVCMFSYTQYLFAVFLIYVNVLSHQVSYLLSLFLSLFFSPSSRFIHVALCTHNQSCCILLPGVYSLCFISQSQRWKLRQPLTPTTNNCAGNIRIHVSLWNHVRISWDVSLTKGLLVC